MVMLAVNRPISFLCRGSRRGSAVFPVMIALVLFAILLGMSLFVLRQQRLHLMNQVAVVYGQIQRSRQELWDLQVRIAEQAQPQKLREAIWRTRLDLEPATLKPGGDHTILTAVELYHGG